MTENLKEIFGTEQKIKDFIDKKSRMAYPITMKNWSSFLDCFMQINYKTLWNNFLTDEAKESLQTILQLTFKDENIEDVMDNINAGNFTKIMDIIMEINGIILKDKSEDDETKNNLEV